MSGDQSSAEVQFCTPLFCVENNEEFRTRTHNEVSILYRVSDKYVNVSKLCSDGGRCFKTFKRGDRWRKIINYWNNRQSKNALPPIYELKGKYDKTRGQYIHPKLIHFVADWISIDYAFKVAEIMDLINERNQILNKTLDDTIIELQDKLDEAYDQIKIKDQQLEQSNKTVIEKDEHISKTSVPIDNSD